MNYPNIIPEGENYIVMGITAMLGLFLLIIVYYIVVSRSGSTNQQAYKQLFNIAQMPGQMGGDSGVVAQQQQQATPIPANAAMGTLAAAPVTTAPEATQPKVSEVYNVKANIYSLDDAPAVCGALGGDVATIEQLIEAHKNGADWCNVGWTKDGLAGYPTQLSTWKILQDSPGQEGSCGKPGINLVRNDPNLLYGVNCYGPKPDPVGSEKVRIGQVISNKQAAINAQIEQLKRGGHIGVNSFNGDKWSAN